MGAGVADRTCRDWEERGRLGQVLPGVYLVGGTPLTYEGRVQAALLWGGDGAVAFHRCAARVWRLDVGLAPIEIAVPGRPRPPRGLKVYTARIDPQDVRRVSGLSVVSPARMLLTLGAVVPERTVESIIDQALRRDLTTPAELSEVMARGARRGVRGAATFRRLMEFRSLSPDALRSELEVRLHRLIRRHHLPEPERGYEIVLGGRRFEIDFAYPDLSIAIEADGREFHTGREATQSDLNRQNQIVLGSWRILRFTWWDVTRRPKHVAAVIRSAIELSVRHSGGISPDVRRERR
jgi:very-short-patch-repair endonuclease